MNKSNTANARTTEEALQKQHLRYVGATELSIERKKRGKGFRYLDSEGNHSITDERLLQRIKLLVIPPAWKNVAISKYANGHIQAVGRDAKGRKQYIYHPEWKKIQQQNKFHRMISFGEMLPKIRQHVRADMRKRGLGREKVVATVVWLLGRTFIRVGNTEYARANKSYGLTTLRNKHVQIERNRVLFEFKGKGGAPHSLEVDHPRVARTIRKCIELPGYELFQYLDNEGQRHVIDSSDVNDYLKTISGEEITAKDFRTWGGTVLAAETLHRTGLFMSHSAGKKNVTKAVKEVAKHLRNTPTVCRSYYIHPAVIDAYLNRILVPHFEKVYQRNDDKPAELSKEEYATWTLLSLLAPSPHKVQQFQCSLIRPAIDA
jgi:DNA topoisomerase I